jgi:putative phage-type endonuclease
MYIYLLTNEQGSKEWHKIRSCLITASDVAAICGKNKYANPDEILNKKIRGYRTGEYNTYTSFAMSTGIREEPFALKEYERVMNVKCNQFGLLRHEHYTWLAGSPDFITDELCPVLGEIKTLITRKHEAGKLPEMYHFQIQALLEILQISTAHAVQFLPNRTVDILPIPRDATWFAKYLPDLYAFHIRLKIYLQEGDYAGKRHDFIQSTIISNNIPILRERNMRRKHTQEESKKDKNIHSLSTMPTLSPKRIRTALLQTI